MSDFDHNNTFGLLAEQDTPNENTPNENTQKYEQTPSEGRVSNVVIRDEAFFCFVRETRRGEEDRDYFVHSSCIRDNDGDQGYLKRGNTVFWSTWDVESSAQGWKLIDLNGQSFDDYSRRPDVSDDDDMLNLV